MKLKEFQGQQEITLLSKRSSEQAPSKVNIKALLDKIKKQKEEIKKKKEAQQKRIVRTIQE